jgi:cytochrome c oxidase subunit 2
VASGGLFLALVAATSGAFGVTWPAAPPAPPAGAAGTVGAADQVARGSSLFQAKGCVACHTIGGVPGSAQVGPNLSGLPAVAGARRPGMAAADYVRQSLVDPQAYVVPGYERGANDPGAPLMPKLPLSAAEIDALVAFLLSPHAA